MKKETLFGVLLLKDNIGVNALGIEKTMKLSWSDGMVGAIPVFKRYEDALEYAGDETIVFKLIAESKQNVQEK